jgi:predicted Zn-dependent protease
MIMRGMAISALAGLPLFAQNQATVGTGVNFYSLEKEAALGSQMAADFRERTTAIASPRVQHYLENLGQKLASQMPRPRSVSLSA